MYKHTQIGWVIIISLVAAMVFIGAVYFMNPETALDPRSRYILIGVGILLLISLLLFYSLTVIVDDTQVIAKLGIGLIKKKFPLEAIESCEKVRNKWYFGWGIRYVVWGKKGWMYNVSGLDAVLVSLKNGKNFRIGTDEPDELVRYISNRLQ